MSCHQQGAGASLSDLPLDLLRPTLAFLQYRVTDLAACAQVSRLFNQAATPYLYERLFLRDHRRLQLVFRTLSQRPELCRLVSILELRVFPFGLNAERLEQLEDRIERTLVQAVNLRQLVWTRTGSLNDRLLPHLLRSSPSLKRLEITGDARTWTTNTLIREIQPGIEHLSIILPERTVINALVDIAAKLQHASSAGLRSLSLLCQHSPLLTDAHLLAMAPALSALERLSLAGCRAVTASGIAAVLKSALSSQDQTNVTGVKELALEGLNVQAEGLIALRPYMAPLRLLSITYPRSSSSSASRVLPPAEVHEFYHNFALLLEEAYNLEELTHYAGAGTKSALDGDQDDSDDSEEEQGQAQEEEQANQARSFEQPPDVSRLELRDQHRKPGQHVHRHGQRSPPPANLPLLPSSFLRQMAASRGSQLRKLRLHGVGISLDQLALIVEGCPRLEDLVIQIWEDDLPSLTELLARLPLLESIHILSSSSSDTVLSELDIQAVAQACSDANSARRHSFQAVLAQAADPAELLCKERTRDLIEGPGLRQIGFRNRVWLIERSCIWDKADGSAPARDEVSGATHEPLLRFNVSLKRWDPAAGMFPEVLLVVKA